jgi:hypothetical protein
MVIFSVWKKGLNQPVTNLTPIPLKPTGIGGRYIRIQLLSPGIPATSRNMEDSLIGIE